VGELRRKLFKVLWSLYRERCVWPCNAAGGDEEEEEDCCRCCCCCCGCTFVCVAHANVAGRTRPRRKAHTSTYRRLEWTSEQLNALRGARIRRHAHHFRVPRSVSDVCEPHGSLTAPSASLSAVHAAGGPLESGVAGSGAERAGSGAAAAAAAPTGDAEGELARLRRELARKNEQLERLERAKTAAELRAAAQKELARATLPPLTLHPRTAQPHGLGES
jgi:hypothetical protein